ncbi:MAG: acetyl ornithine aminotransferase family protein [Methanomassiliicoccales archaeon]|nr:acetyl ornithine aminotransferase family protein [Methanomassiliicoccales archaeon]
MRESADTKFPNIVTELPGPKAKAIVDMDDHYLATVTKSVPLAVDHASGEKVWDVDGNTFLDFASGVAVMNIGHCHPAVVKAVQEQAAKVMHFAGTDYYYDVQAQLAKRLASLAPGTSEKKVFLSNSGAESIEAAMKLTRWSTGRKQFIAFMGAFHGRTLGALSLTCSKRVQRARYFPTVPGVTHIPYANCYRCLYHLEYPSCGLWCAKILDEMYLDALVPPDEVAALFLEAVQGEGGYIVPPKEFLPEIAKICRSHGILTVDDEVQAGMGRTGKMWAIEHFGVEPDVTCMAKSLGSGMPIAATVFRKELDWKSPGAHSNTYGGNCVACAGSMATLNVIEEENIVQQAARKGEMVRKRLEEIKSRFENVGDVRGLGMMRALEFVEDRRSKTPAIKLRNQVVELGYKGGLIMLGCGKSGIRLIPPLNIADENLDKGMDILEECISKVTKDMK